MDGLKEVSIVVSGPNQAKVQVISLNQNEKQKYE